MKKYLPDAPLMLWEIVQYSFKLYSATLRAVILLSFTAAMLCAIPLLGIASLDKQNYTLAPQILPWIASIPFFLLALGLQITIVQKIFCVAIESNIGTFAAFKISVRKMPTLFFIAVQYSVIVLAGTMLLIIPGVILCISLLFSFILCITENLGVSQCITDSHRLVWGNWWRSTLFITFVILVILAVSLSFAVLSLNHSDNIIMLIASQVISQTITFPFMISCIIIMLEELKCRRK